MRIRVGIWLGVAGAAFVSAGFFVGLNLVRWHEARHGRVAGRAAVGELARERRHMETRVADAEKRVGELRTAISQRKFESQSSAPTATPKEKPAPKGRSLDIGHIIRDEPDAQVLFLESQRAGLRVRYGPLFCAAALSAEEAAAFQNNIIARNEKLMDLGNLEREADADAAAIARSRDAAEAEYRAAQAALLGPEKAVRWQEFERTASVREMVSTIAGVAVLEGVSLSSVQAEQVVRVVAQASASFRAGGAVSFAEVDWNAVEPRLREILWPAQIEIFRSLDPGPTAGGLQQNLLYAAVDRANAAARAESKRRASDTAAKTKP